ncbi:MAG: NAD(P)H-dependent oxidoreductase [Sphingomonas sp.]|jgi:FMN-dependent NADH-azoreductase|uniref:FMN-dependent NADH-azoreductase n=1 Tax=Sphingomonas sp. TaxID=28214 RepID=UPI0035638FAA
MKILHIDCSPRLDSHSRALSAAIVGKLLAIASDATIIRRDLGVAPLPAATADYATTLSSPTTLAAPVPGSLDLSEELIHEIEAADMIVIGTPMHNLTVPAVLKAWIDQIMRAGRTFRSTPAGKVGMIGDRPVFIGIASGGTFSGERANQPDFLTSYLSAVLGSMGLKSLQFFPVQATAFLDAEQGAIARDAALAMLDLADMSPPPRLVAAGGA